MQSRPPNRKIAAYSREIPRDQRFETRLWVRVNQTTCDKMAAKLTNISRTGCKFETMITLNSSERLMIRFPDGQKLAAIIKWSNIGSYGCEFTSRLNDSELTEIVRAGSKISI